MEQKKQTEQERREARRARRIRNQVISFLVLILIFVALVVGGWYVYRMLTQKQEAQKEEQQMSQEILEDILAAEEEIDIPEVEPEPETPAVVELTPQQKLDEIVNAGLEVMPLEDKVAGLFIITPEALTGVSNAVKAGEGTQKALAEYAVGGLIYSKQNIRSESQFKEMLDNTELYSKYPIFLCVEEEGGKYSTVANSGIGQKADSAATIGPEDNENLAYLAALAMGDTLSQVGINLDLAPVADVTSVENAAIGERSYGSDARLVGDMVAAMVHGLSDRKITNCLKHFPGMGGTTKDPAKGMASVDRTEAEFREEDFSAFRAGIEAGADMVMISCVSAPELTGDSEPCVFSSKVITDILRNELQFNGVIITDALNMAAISTYYGADEAAIMALKAGCDMILMPEDFEKAYNGVLEAVQNGTISEERINDSLRRIYRIKYADKIE